jgi:N-acetylglucosamine kinase-like BadF-type ATPase
MQALIPEYMPPLNILLVESGATKANWALLSNNECVFKEKSPGLNPYFLTDQEMTEQFSSVRKKLPKEIHQIYFYSTGCGAEDQKKRVGNLLDIVFQPLQSAFVDTDIIAAARSIGPHSSGLVGILGTGSNACLIKNGEIDSTAGGFGFILGDEGSGSALGLLLITGWLKNELPLDIQTLVNTDLHLDKAEIFQAVYKNPFPSRYLASLAPFFFKHKELPWIMDRVKEQFDWFVKRYFLTLIGESQSVKVYLIGSVAYYFSDIMKGVLLEHHLELGDIVKDPMDGLIAFHSHN